MSDLEKLSQMSTLAGIKFSTRREPGFGDRKSIRILGRFAADQTIFKFDENGKLISAGYFE